MSTLTTERLLSLNDASVPHSPLWCVEAALELQTIIHRSHGELSNAAGHLITLGSSNPELTTTFESECLVVADSRLNVSPIFRRYNKAHGTDHQSHSAEWHLTLLAMFLAGATMQGEAPDGLTDNASAVLEKMESAYSQAQDVIGA